MEPVVEEITPNCNNCGLSVKPSDRFCPNCGAAQIQISDSWNDSGFDTRARKIGIFYVVSLLLCLLPALLSFFSDYGYVFALEMALAAWTVGFAITEWKDIKPLYSLRNVNILLMIGLVLLSIAGSALVNVSVTHLNQEVYGVDDSLFDTYESLPYATVIFFLSMAVYPAIFEELAFRGYVFNAVRDLAGPASAMAISSMSFAIIHQSVISLAWLVPFAFCLGYLRHRYNTLWYGIVMHFFFNATACVFDLWRLGLLDLAPL